MSKSLENAPVIKAQLIAYYFNLDDYGQSEEYGKLTEHLKGLGLQCFNVIADSKPDSRSKITTGEIELETRHLFNNQWNTTDTSPANPGMRVFDWYEGIYPNNRRIKAGHYIIPNDAIKEIRNSVKKCGYCGAMHWASKGLVFCDQCLGNEYLKETDLNLLRLRYVSEDDRNTAPLSEAEKAHIMPLYVAAQTEGADTRKGQYLANQRKKIISEYEKAIEEAETKKAGFLWLMDNGVSIDNCIYYSHTKKFSFGWRNPVSDSVRDRLLEIISEFPFPYEIKCADGKTLEDY